MRGGKQTFIFTGEERKDAPASDLNRTAVNDLLLQRGMQELLLLLLVVVCIDAVRMRELECEIYKGLLYLYSNPLILKSDGYYHLSSLLVKHHLYKPYDLNRRSQSA